MKPQEWRDASGLGGSAMRVTAEEMRQIHGEIWPIPGCYLERVDDPAPQSPDVRAAWVSFFAGVGPGR